MLLLDIFIRFGVIVILLMNNVDGVFLFMILMIVNLNFRLFVDLLSIFFVIVNELFI